MLTSFPAVDDCERLCAEADNLLGRSEEAQDLITALSYCNAAAGKARAAMDAPYSNPQTASAARMKHNACVMRARSLHRKLEEPAQGNRRKLMFNSNLYTYLSTWIFFLTFFPMIESNLITLIPYLKKYIGKFKLGVRSVII